MDTEGGKHGGKITLQFFDREHKPIAYDQWIFAWAEDLNETLRMLEKTIDSHLMERIWMHGENFGLELALEQWDTKGRTASVTWGLFCVPNAGRRGNAPHDTCCGVYEVATDVAGCHLSRVQKVKGR